MKMIDRGPGRSFVYACLFGLALVVLSPLARAGVNTAGTQAYKPTRYHNMCGMGINSKNWNQGPGFKKYAENGGNTAAWKAIIFGNIKTLEIKQSPNLVNNATLLMLAAGNPHPGPLAVLLARGANPNTRWDSAPLLFYSVQCPSSPNTAFLLQAGANVYETNPDSDSANVMSVAILAILGQPLKKSSSYIHGIEMLLAAGYDPRCPASDKFTPIQLAQRLGKYGSPAFKQVVKLLQHAVMIAEARHPGPPECDYSGPRNLDHRHR